MDPVARLQAAIEQARPVIASVTVDMYERPTNCGDWTVKDLANHMVMALTMFRDVARDGEASPAIFTADLIGEDPLSAFNTVGEQVVELWGSGARMEGQAKLPYGEFPAMFAVQLPAMDMVVHSWDLATSTGIPVEWNGPLVTETLEFVTGTFTSPEMRGEDFAAPVVVPETSDDLTKLVAFLGRQP